MTMPYGSGSLVVPPSASTGSPYGTPASMYNLLGVSMDPATAQTVGTVSPTQNWFQRIYVPAGQPITNLWVGVGVAGSWDGLTHNNQVGLYTDDGQTQVGTTADDGTLWTALGWRGGAVVGGPVAAGAARFMYIVPICRGMTGLSWVFADNASDAHASWVSLGPSQTRRRSAYNTLAALPATFDPTTIGTNTGYTLLCGFN